MISPVELILIIRVLNSPVLCLGLKKDIPLSMAKFFTELRIVLEGSS